MQVVTNYLTKPQYSYTQASISFLVNHGPQILTASVFITLFKFVSRKTQSSNINHFSFYDSVSVLESCLRTSILETNQFGIIRYPQICPKLSLWVILLLELKQGIKVAHIPYLSLKNVNWTQSGLYKLVNHDRLWYQMGWTTHYSK